MYLNMTRFRSIKFWNSSTNTRFVSTITLQTIKRLPVYQSSGSWVWLLLSLVSHLETGSRTKSTKEIIPWLWPKIFLLRWTLIFTRLSPTPRLLAVSNFNIIIFKTRNNPTFLNYSLERDRCPTLQGGIQKKKN